MLDDQTLDRSTVWDQRQSLAAQPEPAGWSDPGPLLIRFRTGAKTFIEQLLMVGGAVLLYFAVRGLTQGDEAAAIAHGLDLLRFESFFGLDLESGFQNSIIDNTNLVTLANWIYIWGHWPAIVVTLTWLYRNNPVEFRLLRNAIFASGAIGLIIFMSYPVAPPRLLDSGMIDTIAEQSASYRVLQPPSLVNKYAALPSLHVGWNLLVGLAIIRVAGNWPLRLVGVLSPLAMIAAVILTANHFVLDAVAGTLVALAGLTIAGSLLSPARTVSCTISHPRTTRE